MLRELGRGELSRSATAIIAILSSSRCCEATWRRAGRWSGALVRARWPTGTAMEGSLRARRALLYTRGIPIHHCTTLDCGMLLHASAAAQRRGSYESLGVGRSGRVGSGPTYLPILSCMSRSLRDAEFDTFHR